jgi:hypothetical protein
MVLSVAVIRALCGRGEVEGSSIGRCLVSHVSQSEGRSGLAKTQRGCDIHATRQNCGQQMLDMLHSSEGFSSS